MTFDVEHFSHAYWPFEYIECFENSLAVQWLGLHAFTAEGMGSIPGRGTKIPHASQCGQNLKKGN